MAHGMHGLAEPGPHGGVVVVSGGTAGEREEQRYGWCGVGPGVELSWQV